MPGKKIIFVGLVFLFLPFFIQATEIEFNVDPSYDFAGRAKVSAFLYQIGENIYFYVENDFYNGLDIDKKKEFSAALNNLSQEFDNNIYPKVREAFGSEPNPGIDNDSKTFVLVSQIKGDAGGYFNSGDNYPKIQNPVSNEKEIIYLNSKFITDPLARSFLAHEFSHLITFNQKDKIRGVTEDVWLNEARAEYASTLLGYDTDYQSSNLKRRVRAFLEKPNDSLTEWRNEASDYGIINLFTQYLTEHYGLKIITDSLKSAKTGISSLNEALLKSGASKDFSQIFTDWTITVLANDCGLGQEYCYLNPNLKNLKISPQLNFLPSISESSLTVTNFTKDWAGNWFKFVGGQGTLKLEFIGDQKDSFNVPYLLEGLPGRYVLDYLKLDNSQRGTSYFSDFGRKNTSLIIIPTIQTKITGFDNLEDYRRFFWTVSTLAEQSQQPNQEEQLIKSLLAQIALLQEQVAKLQIQAAQNSPPRNNPSNLCLKIEKNLSFGLKNSAEVRCLQEFLKNQSKDIYPEALVTGNFGVLTQRAVVRFQEKYAADILTPLGLKKGTGFVGVSTRAKINQLRGF